MAVVVCPDARPAEDVVGVVGRLVVPPARPSNCCGLRTRRWCREEEEEEVSGLK
jgi:hypothetical protein